MVLYHTHSTHDIPIFSHSFDKRFILYLCALLSVFLYFIQFLRVAFFCATSGTVRPCNWLLFSVRIDIEKRDCGTDRFSVAFMAVWWLRCRCFISIFVFPVFAVASSAPIEHIFQMAENQFRLLKMWYWRWKFQYKNSSIFVDLRYVNHSLHVTNEKPVRSVDYYLGVENDGIWAIGEILVVFLRSVFKSFYKFSHSSLHFT